MIFLIIVRNDCLTVSILESYRRQVISFLSPEYWSEQETPALETKTWKEGNLSRPTQRPTHPNPNTFPLCGPVRWSLKCCHDGSALSAQYRPTDALPRDRLEGSRAAGLEPHLLCPEYK